MNRRANLDGHGQVRAGVKARMALWASIACAGVAVAIVGLDLAFNVEASLETRGAASAPWQVIGSAGTRGGPAYGFGIEPCGLGPEVRLSVTNGQLLGGSFDVAVSYSRADGTFVQPLRQSWHLAHGETRTYNFTIPASDFEPALQGTPKPSPSHTIYLNAQVDDIYLSGCVTDGTEGGRA